MKAEGDINAFQTISVHKQLLNIKRHESEKLTRGRNISGHNWF